MEIINKLIIDNDLNDLKLDEDILNCIIKYNDIIKDKKDPFQEIYRYYNEIKKKEIDSSLENELKNYHKIDLFIDNKPNIQTNIMKECHIEALKKVVDGLKIKKNNIIQKKIDLYSDDYQYYPDKEDKKMIDKITLKKEFNIHELKKEKKTLEDICDQSFFELQSHQYFLKNLISGDSQYNSLLIFHGVGVGKTCSGVSIAENFKDIYGQDENKIIILASSNIQIGWRKTIYNPSVGDNQCTGDTYLIEDKNPINIDKEAKKIVKKYYDLYGYAAFANKIKKLLDKRTVMIPTMELKLKKEKEIIKEIYSNRVLIIDEVHNIRNDTDGEKLDRDTLIYIEKVIRYSDNLKLVLLTANPMFNQPNEIIWILNMLLLNDKKELINEKVVFKNDILTELGEKILIEKSKGYVSYLRGENPISFPIRKYPKKRVYNYDYLDENEMKGKLYRTNILTNENSNKIDIFNNSRLKEKEKISFLKLYLSPIYLLQKDKYKEKVKQYENQEKLRIEEEGSLLQLSNICYPGSDDLNDTYGDKGFDNNFVLTKGINQYSYRLNTVKNYNEFLKEEEIWKYSSKIYTILQEIKNSDGIIFIYTNYLKSGVIPLALALEQNGYSRYNEKPLLNSKKKRNISYDGIYKDNYLLEIEKRIREKGKYTEKDIDEKIKKEEYIQGKYIIISGGSLTKNLEDKLKVLTSKENKDGKKIKIVIGSSVAAEGLDFKNIRNIHIMEPWHNLNKMEQVIGRGIRNCSHKDLSSEKRNVSIYLHSIDNGINESIEMYLYRISEKKSKEIGKIETILKQNAIDKYLFKANNLIKKDEIGRFPIQLSYRDNKNKIYKIKDKDILIDEYYEPYDKPETRTCSFQKDCDYLKDLSLDMKINKKEIINTDTYSYIYMKSYIDIQKKRIALLFTKYYLLTINEIIQLIEDYKEVKDDIIYKALDEMILDKYIIKSSKGDLGYLILKNNYYIFQPYFNENNKLSLYYRANKGLNKKTDYIIPKLKIEKMELPEYYYYEKEVLELFINGKIKSITELYKIEKEQDRLKDFNIIKDVFDLFSKYIDEESNLKQELKQIEYEYILERLSFDDKIKLLYLFYQIIIKDEKYKLIEKIKELILKNISQLLIYYDKEKDDYYYLKDYKEKYKKDLFGGFIYYYPENKVIFFKYNEDRLIRCNKIEEYDILRCFKRYNRIDKLSYKKNWGYLFYSKRWDRFMNNMILKVVSEINKDKPKERFPPGEGVIIMDSVPGWYVNNMLDFIKDKDGLYNYYSKLNERGQGILNKKIEIKERVNLYYSTFIEICFRLNKQCIHPDLIWLRYNK